MQQPKATAHTSRSRTVFVQIFVLLLLYTAEPHTHLFHLFGFYVVIHMCDILSSASCPNEVIVPSKGRKEEKLDCGLSVCPIVAASSIAVCCNFCKAFKATSAELPNSFPDICTSTLFFITCCTSVIILFGLSQVNCRGQTGRRSEKPFYLSQTKSCTSFHAFITKYFKKTFFTFFKRKVAVVFMLLPPNISKPSVVFDVSGFQSSSRNPGAQVQVQVQPAFLSIQSEYLRNTATLTQ